MLKQMKKLTKKGEEDLAEEWKKEMEKCKETNCMGMKSYSLEDKVS